ncbi:hypothetical protein L5515_017264 [Caenorhabditis briggsae]|uniref:Uncharacterized protein n=1 Tax=Caenorhabditis briggsae TaxID=6238 RepID=A0AAE9FF01_CAEBR|nr:hypothetical protein L5515_017262 [Caenorhabditis briggsae]UMM40748.1 hypothetical protein L5515_017264 [Caenorhabditis briggsae]
MEPPDARSLRFSKPTSKRRSFSESQPTVKSKENHAFFHRLIKRSVKSSTKRTLGFTTFSAKFDLCALLSTKIRELSSRRASLKLEPYELDPNVVNSIHVPLQQTEYYHEYDGKQIEMTVGILFLFEKFLASNQISRFCHIN